MTKESNKLLETGYKNFSEFSVSKEEYLKLKRLDKDNMEGTEWKIYQFEDPENEGESFAYKKIKMSISKFGYSLFYKQLFRELDITNKARHPCTIELISFDLSDISDPSIVTKFYKYQSLKNNFYKKGEDQYSFIKSDYAKWGGMELTGDNTIKVRDGTVYTKFLYGIARGINYLHSHKIFHRDLKPDNIVVDKYFLPHIADFGFSKITGDGIDQSRKVGSGPYMAPEIHRPGYNYSFPADIFALGLIFYSLTECKTILPDRFFDKKKSKLNPRMMLNMIAKRYSTGQMPTVSSGNPLAGLIPYMLSVDPEQRPKIEDVVKFLEEPNHHFENTDENEFQEYKNQIDNFEKEQLPLIKDTQIQFKDEAGNLKKQLNKSKPSSNNNKKYHELQILLKGSFESDSEAECSLGIIFYTGYYGIPKDYATAWYYFNESHKHGNTQSKIFMTNILNEIVEEELRINNEHFSNISINNLEINDPIFQKIRHSNSQLILGMLKESETKYNESYNLYIKSIKQGNETAKTRLGILLYKTNQYPKLCETILTETSRWKYDEDNIKQTPERTLSLLYLGLLKQNRPESLNESIKIFEQLLSEDHPDAALLLGQCYEKKNDIPKAIKYYQLSFDKYSNESANKLAQFLENKLKNDPNPDGNEK